MQVSEEIEGIVTKKLFQEFSRLETRSLGALSQLNHSFLNLQIRAQSGVVPGTSQNSNTEDQELKGDHSQQDPCPEV